MARVNEGGWTLRSRSNFQWNSCLNRWFVMVCIAHWNLSDLNPCLILVKDYFSNITKLELTPVFNFTPGRLQQAPYSKACATAISSDSTEDPLTKNLCRV